MDIDTDIVTPILCSHFYILCPEVYSFAEMHAPKEQGTGSESIQRKRTARSSMCEFETGNRARMTRAMR